MNKTDLLFQMMEQPQAYTEQRWQEILSDEECRELYNLMAKTQSAFDAQKEIDDEAIDAAWQDFEAKHFPKAAKISILHKVAAFLTFGRACSCSEEQMQASLSSRLVASFIGLLFISGIAFAAVHIVRNMVEKEIKAPTQETKISDSHQPIVAADTIKSDTIVMATSVVFDNVTLDSIAKDIAAYHHIGMELRNDQARQLRFYFVWKRDDSLQEVVEKLNMFEHVNMAVKDGKLIVR